MTDFYLLSVGVARATATFNAPATLSPGWGVWPLYDDLGNLKTCLGQGGSDLLLN
jgi:hypothetical protein